MAAIDKIFDLLDTEPDMQRRARARASWARSAGDVEFDGVWFCYGDGPDDERRASRPGRCATCRCDIRAGRDARAGRRDGRGQVDAREAGGALLRPAARRRAGRRARPARGDAGEPAQPARHRAAGGLPVRRDRAREHPLRAAGRERARAGRRRARGRRARVHQGGCRTATTPTSASAAAGCRRASGSSSRSRAR